MKLQHNQNKQAFKDGYINLMVYPSMPTVNIVYDDRNYSNREYTSYHIPLDKVAQTLDHDEFNEIMDIMNADFDFRQLMRAFLLGGEPQFGVRHVDTYHDDEKWRFQINVNYRIYPNVVDFLGRKYVYDRVRVWKNTFDSIVFTFTMRKKRVEEDI